MAEVTVLLPIYNSITHLDEALNSVITQTYTDWDMICINEYGSNDGSAELVNQYAKKDDRIKFIQNETKLGLGASLNKGIKEAEGKFIARMDADDIMHPDRLKREVDFMNHHQEIAVVGSYQHHFGPDIDLIHKPPIEPEQVKTNLLFFCDLCHSTLMLRKEFFLNNNLLYDNNYLAEDFELWTRVVKIGSIANIPDVLMEYRVGRENITNNKRNKMNTESGSLVLRNLKDNLGIDIDPEKSFLFNGWDNPYAFENAGTKRRYRLEELEKILKRIIDANNTLQYYERDKLLKTVSAKWNWACNYKPFNVLPDIVDEKKLFKKEVLIPGVSRLIFFCQYNKGNKKKLIRILNKIKNEFKTKIGG